MDEKRLRLIHTACGIVISVALIVAAVCLITSAYAIYKSGDAPYNPESIGAEYAKIAVPLWISIFAVIAGLVLNIALPAPKSKKKAQNDPFVRLRILQKKLGASETGDAIKKERNLRKTLRIVFSLLCLAAFIPAVFVLCDYDSFTVANLTPALLRTVTWLAVGAVVSAVLLILLSILEDKSAEREIAKTKLALSDSEKKPVQNDEKSSENSKKIIRLVLVGAACALVVIGLTEDGFYDVLQKAIRICTECIGLG